MGAPVTDRPDTVTADRPAATNWLTGPFGASVAAVLVFLMLWQVVGLVSDRIPGPAPVERGLPLQPGG